MIKRVSVAEVAPCRPRARPLADFGPCWSARQEILGRSTKLLASIRPAQYGGARSTFGLNLGGTYCASGKSAESRSGEGRRRIFDGIEAASCVRSPLPARRADRRVGDRRLWRRRQQ